MLLQRTAIISLNIINLFVFKMSRVQAFRGNFLLPSSEKIIAPQHL